VLLNIAIGTTRLEVSHHPFYPGGTFRGFVSQSGRLHVRWFQVQLVCEEQAIYQQGTDTRRATSRVHRATLFSQRKFEMPLKANLIVFNSIDFANSFNSLLDLLGRVTLQFDQSFALAGGFNFFHN
jgi:hypothetical protein